LFIATYNKYIGTPSQLRYIVISARGIIANGSTMMDSLMICCNAFYISKLIIENNDEESIFKQFHLMVDKRKDIIACIWDDVYGIHR
jgi:hypothetical protein